MFPFPIRCNNSFWKKENFSETFSQAMLRKQTKLVVSSEDRVIGCVTHYHAVINSEEEADVAHWIKTTCLSEAQKTLLLLHLHLLLLHLLLLFM